MTKTERKIVEDNLRKLTDLIIKEVEETYEEGYNIGYQHGCDDTEDKYNARHRNESKD